MRPEPQFDDPQVRRVPVGDGEDCAAKEERAESIVCVSDDAIRSSVALPRIQIEIRARFFEEAVDEEADPSRIGNQAEPDLFALARDEDLPVFLELRAEVMAVGSATI